MTAARRVAIVGVGIKAPGGCSVRDYWHAIENRMPAARTLDELVAEGAPVTFGCPVTDDDTSEKTYFSRSELRRVDPFARFGIAAAVDAVAELELDALAPPHRRGVFVGVGLGGLSTYQAQRKTYWEDGYARCSPFTIPMVMPNAVAAACSIRWGLAGPTATISNACAAGATAIGMGARLIQTDDADFVLAGGAEALLIDSVVTAFARMEALADENNDPRAASRPFSASRSGFVLGEGAAMLALAEEKAAEAAGAPIIARLSGFAMNSDAFHIAAPIEDGSVGARCMSDALSDGGVEPADVVSINAHGTSTPRNDLAESKAIARVFGAGSPPVTSVKGVTGHLLGASGAVEAVTAAVSSITGIVPPVANTEAVDPEIASAIDVVIGTSRRGDGGPVLSNSFAFGGHNACMVVEPGPDGQQWLADNTGIAS